MLGFIHGLDARFGWWDDREAAIVKARSYADRALELDPNNADGHIALGVLCLLKERYDEAVSHTRKAVQLAPGSADIANLAGFILALSGCPEEALVLAQKSIALAQTIQPYISAFSAMLTACQDRLRKRLPLSKHITLAAPVLASPIL